MSFFNKPAPPSPAAEEGPLAEFVLLTIPGEHFNWRLRPDKALNALIEELSTHLAERDTGEIRFVESTKGAALVYVDGPNAEQIFTDILPILKRTPICMGVRIGVDIDVNDKQDHKPKREVTLD